MVLMASRRGRCRPASSGGVDDGADKRLWKDMYSKEYRVLTIELYKGMPKLGLVVGGDDVNLGMVAMGNNPDIISDTNGTWKGLTQTFNG
jgi:hypothetical protein